MTLLTIGQAVQDEVGLPRLTSIFASTDRTARRIRRLADRAGKRLFKAHPWTALHVEHIITAQGSTTEFGLPSDFHRFLNETHWDRSNRWMQHGPLMPFEWQELKSGQIAAGIRVRWRVMKGSSTLVSTFHIDSTLGTVTTLVFEYVSQNWVVSSAGAGQASFQADGDTSLIDEELIELDLIWRLKRSLGFDYSEDKLTADNAVDLAIAQDGGMPVLSLDGSPFRRRRWPNVPDTGLTDPA